jgi:hypothetical protein
MVPVAAVSSLTFRPIV